MQLEKPTARRKLSTISNLLISPQKILNDLEQALKDKSLRVHYQPQFNAESNSYNHMEALIRWNHPQFGNIPPSVFVPMAEESQLIDELTALIIEQVASDLVQFLSVGIEIESVGINISAAVFADEDRAKNLIEQLSSVAMFANVIVLELTETAVLKKKAIACEYLEGLRELGFKVALDDFGTGYASIGQLLDLPVDIIKIDRSFVSALPNCQKREKIIQAIMVMASSLGLAVVCEGIETEDQFRALGNLGCKMYQGYYFSKVLNSEQILQFLHNYKLSA